MGKKLEYRVTPFSMIVSPSFPTKPIKLIIM